MPESSSSPSPDAPDFVAMARRIAERAHEGQFRRDGVTPYVRHPEDVARRVQGDAVAEAAAWLHDVLEDTEVTADELRQEGIPEAVIEVVRLLTHDNGAAYDRYLAAIAQHPVAKRVKTADMIANLNDGPTQRQIVKYARGLLVLHGTGN